MSKTNKECQSCGMPLKKDEKGGGSNADGSKSTMYCSHCYQQGKFTEQDITFQEMKDKVKGKIKSMGFGSLMAWFFTSNMHKLERWKKK